MLISASVQQLLTLERQFLSDLQAFLQGQQAPAEAVQWVREALRGLDETFLLKCPRW